MPALYDLHPPAVWRAQPTPAKTPPRWPVERPQPTNLADPIVPPVRQKLFGAWEMNWLAYNEAHDVKLPGSSGPAVGFLMYPQAENGKERLDSLDPDNFKYTITARELNA